MLTTYIATATRKSSEKQAIQKKFVPNKNGYVGMSVEQSLHYCLSESKMIICNIYG